MRESLKSSNMNAPWNSCRESKKTCMEVDHDERRCCGLRKMWCGSRLGRMSKMSRIILRRYMFGGSCLLRHPAYRVIQRDHVSYDPEITQLLFQSEHNIVTRLRRLLKAKQVSIGFLAELEKFCRTRWNEYHCPLTESEMAERYKENQRIREERQKKRRRRK